MDPQHSGNWESAWAALLWSFVAAGAYSLLANFLPWIRAFPIFTWVGLQVQTPALIAALHQVLQAARLLVFILCSCSWPQPALLPQGQPACRQCPPAIKLFTDCFNSALRISHSGALQSATAWGWVLAPSMGYVGQGMIMGPRTAFSMLGGAIAGGLSSVDVWMFRLPLHCCVHHLEGCFPLPGVPQYSDRHVCRCPAISSQPCCVGRSGSMVVCCDELTMRGRTAGFLAVSVTAHAPSCRLQGTLTQHLVPACQCPRDHALQRSMPAAGYGILGPFARSKGWAPGSIGDWKSGATGWILWVSLAIMLGDSLTSLALLLGQSALQELRKRRWAQRLAGVHCICRRVCGRVGTAELSRCG